MASKKNKALKVKFNFKEIKTLSFNFKEPDHSIAKDTHIQFKYESKFMIRPESDEIIIRLKIKAVEQDDNILGSIEVEFIYQVKNLKQFETKENEIEIPDNLLRTLIFLTVSTTRGILFEKGTGTVLEKFIFPPIEIKPLIPTKFKKVK